MMTGVLMSGEYRVKVARPSWRAVAAVFAARRAGVQMGAQLSSASAQEADPQSSMRPGWPMGQPPDMMWGSDRGLQATLQASALTHQHWPSRPAAAACTPQRAARLLVAGLALLA